MSFKKSAANGVCVSALLSSSFQFITGDTVFANSRLRPTYISEENKKKIGLLHSVSSITIKIHVCIGGE
jgi:hypothetical protein